MTKRYSQSDVARFYRKNNLPYAFDTNVSRLAEDAASLYTDVAYLADTACPEDYAVFTVTMHPEFSGELCCPYQLIEHLGFTCIGAHPCTVYSRLSLDFDTPEQQSAAEIFVLGKRSGIKEAADKIRAIEAGSFLADQLCTVENIRSCSTFDRIDLPGEYSKDLFIVALFSYPGKTEEDCRKLFKTYAAECGYEVNPNFLFNKEGMIYLLIKGSRPALDSIAEYAFVRSVTAPKYLQVNALDDEFDDLYAD